MIGAQVMNLNLDFGFINWALIQSFILKGFLFSVQLTLVAMIGGIALGTILALMRLSGQAVAGDAGGGLRQHAALDPAGDGDPVVLPADPAR